MKKILLFTLFILLLSTLLSAKDVVWQEDMNKALELAKKTNKPILINFTGSDWCIWCKRLQSEVFSQSDFIKYANKNLILVKIDFPKDIKQTDAVKKANRALADEYKIEGFPTIILLDSKGTKIAQTGYQEGGAKKYVEHIKGLLTKK